MIVKDKNRTETVFLTLNEKSEYVRLGVQPYFLFVLESENNSQVVKFTSEDISTQPDRHNRFRWSEFYNNTDPNDLLDGKFYLTGNTSQWTYTVYESAVPFSADTLDIQYTTGKVVESGRLQLRGNDTQINDVYK